MVSPSGSSWVVLGEMLRFEAYRYRVHSSVPVLPYAFVLGERGERRSSAAVYVLPTGTFLGKVETFAMSGGKSLPGLVGMVC